uniref:Acyl_transf_3 domain-containing protein n=1 Tax=Heterorhabditis bacteriophora TaxID=37862 RepID=A0A1I7WE48_HETBA
MLRITEEPIDEENYPALPEIKLCYAVTISTMIYAWYGVFRASQNYQWKIGDYGMMSSLPFIGPIMKDFTNWEWHRWSSFAQNYMPVFLVHTVLFNSGSLVLPELLFTLLYMAFSISACAIYFTPTLVALSLLQGTLVFIASRIVRKKLTVWLSSIPVLYLSMHHTKFLAEDPFLIFTFVSYSMLSYISYCIETLKSPIRKEDDTLIKSYLRMMFYTFYQPYLFSLIVLYPDFERQMEERKTKQREHRQVLWSAMRIVFWWILVETMLHFFYFEAILKDRNYTFSLPKDQFVALGMALGR